MARHPALRGETPAVNAPQVAELAAIEDVVGELPDPGLRELATLVSNLTVRVQTELAARRRGRTGPLHLSPAVVVRFRARVSCVFCRHVYLADLIPDHVLTEHRQELEQWRARRVV